MPKQQPRTAEPIEVAADDFDDRLRRLGSLAAALAAEIELLREDLNEWRRREREALEAGKGRRGRPGRRSAKELQAVPRDEQPGGGLARVAALELVAEGLDREAVTAELERLGIDDPEPVVSEAFRHAAPTAKAG